jgi:hypothetical protein
MKERAINKQNEPQKERKSRWRMYNKKPAKENGASHPIMADRTIESQSSPSAAHYRFSQHHRLYIVNCT